MKTLIETATGLSKYIFADDATIMLEADRTVTPDFIIGDLHAGNAALIEGITPPADWAGGRYTCLDEQWARASQLVPQTVTRFQARAALHLAGLLEAVETMMQSPDTPMLARLAWQDAQVFERQSPTVLTLAEALSLSDADLDQLFIDAAGIKA